MKDKKKVRAIVEGCDLLKDYLLANMSEEKYNKEIYRDVLDVINEPFVEDDAIVDIAYKLFVLVQNIFEGEDTNEEDDENPFAELNPDEDDGVGGEVPPETGPVEGEKPFSNMERVLDALVKAEERSNTPNGFGKIKILLKPVE